MARPSTVSSQQQQQQQLVTEIFKLPQYGRPRPESIFIRVAGQAAGATAGRRPRAVEIPLNQYRLTSGCLWSGPTSPKIGASWLLMLHGGSRADSTTHPCM